MAVCNAAPESIVRESSSDAKADTQDPKSVPPEICRWCGGTRIDSVEMMSAADMSVEEGGGGGGVVIMKSWRGRSSWKINPR